MSSFFYFCDASERVLGNLLALDNATNGKNVRAAVGNGLRGSHLFPKTAYNVHFIKSIYDGFEECDRKIQFIFFRPKQTFTCSKLTTETLEKGVKKVVIKSPKRRH